MTRPLFDSTSRSIGSHRFFYLAIVILAIAVVLQTGATSAVKAVKMSAKIVAGSTPEQADVEVFGTPVTEV